MIVNGGFLAARSDRVLDPLKAKCLVLDNGETKLAIVVVDVCMMTRELIDGAKKLASEEGILAGISAGAAMAGAAKVAQKIDSGVIVFIVADAGWKYLSTGAYTDDLDSAEAKAEKIIYF